MVLCCGKAPKREIEQSKTKRDILIEKELLRKKERQAEREQQVEERKLGEQAKETLIEEKIKQALEEAKRANVVSSPERKRDTAGELPRASIPVPIPEENPRETAMTQMSAGTSLDVGCESPAKTPRSVQSHPKHQEVTVSQASEEIDFQQIPTKIEPNFQEQPTIIGHPATDGLGLSSSSAPSAEPITSPRSQGSGTAPTCHSSGTRASRTSGGCMGSIKDRRSQASLPKIDAAEKVDPTQSVENTFKQAVSIDAGALRKNSGQSYPGQEKIEAIHRTLTKETIEEQDIIHGMKFDDPENVKLYHESLASVTQLPEDWEVGYHNEKPGEQAQVRFKIHDNRSTAEILAICLIPHNVVDCMAPVMEVDTWKDWHPLCNKHERTGPFDAYRFTSHFEQSFMFGAYKGEQNTVTYRWVNETQGFYLQELVTLEEGEVGYFSNPKYTREKVYGSVLCIAMGENQTIIIQKFKNELPMKIPGFIEKFFMKTFCPNIIKTLYDNSKNAKNPKGPFYKHIQEDKNGQYAVLRKIIVPGDTQNKPWPVIYQCQRVVGMKIDAEEEKANVAKSQKKKRKSKQRNLFRSMSSRFDKKRSKH